MLTWATTLSVSLPQSPFLSWVMTIRTTSRDLSSRITRRRPASNAPPHEYNWQSDRSDKLKLTSTGSGGLAELRDQLDDSKASYGYVRVQYSNDKESTREKFILVIWIGPDCKVMRKAKVRSLHLHLPHVLHLYSPSSSWCTRVDCRRWDVF